MSNSNKQAIASLLASVRSLPARGAVVFVGCKKRCQPRRIIGKRIFCALCFVLFCKLLLEILPSWRVCATAPSKVRAASALSCLHARRAISRIFLLSSLSCDENVTLGFAVAVLFGRRELGTHNIVELFEQFVQPASAVPPMVVRYIFSSAA